MCTNITAKFVCIIMGVSSYGLNYVGGTFSSAKNNHVKNGRYKMCSIANANFKKSVTTICE